MTSFYGVVTVQKTLNNCCIAKKRILEFWLVSSQNICQMVFIEHPKSYDYYTRQESDWGSELHTNNSHHALNSSLSL